MLLKLVIALGILALGNWSASKATASEKPDFSGTWKTDGAIADAEPLLTIVQNGQDLRITAGADQKRTTDVTCNTMGKECEATLQGQNARVSYYYNGPVLVETVLEGKNNERVMKVTRTLSENGQDMVVEVVAIVPAGKSQKITYHKEAVSASAQQSPGPTSAKR